MGILQYLFIVLFILTFGNLNSVLRLHVTVIGKRITSRRSTVKLADFLTSMGVASVLDVSRGSNTTGYVSTVCVLACLLGLKMALTASNPKKAGGGLPLFSVATAGRP